MSQKSRQSRQSSRSTQNSTQAEPLSQRNARGRGEGTKSSGLEYLASPDPSTTSIDHFDIEYMSTGDLPDFLGGPLWRSDDDPHISTSSWSDSCAADLPDLLAITDNQYFSAFLNIERQGDHTTNTVISPPPSDLKGSNTRAISTTKSGASENIQGRLRNLAIPGPAKSTDGCRCLQELSSCLFALDKCKSGQMSLSSPQTHERARSLEIDDFLDLFKHSMMRLRAVESCHSSCLISREFGVLLLISLEQLTKLLLDLVANTPGCTKSVFSQTSHCASALTASAQQGSCESSSFGPQENRDINIGKFKLRDPLDHQVIIEQLLRIRVRDLQSFIKTVGDKMEYYELKDLGARFNSIHDEIAKTLHCT